MAKYNAGADLSSALAYWMHDHFPYSEFQFLMGRGCVHLTFVGMKRLKRILLVEKIIKCF